KITVQAAVSDPDGDPLTYNWSPPSGWSASSNGDTLTLTAPNAYDTTGTVKMTVSDGFDSTSSTIQVSTAQNYAPSIASLDGTPNPVAPGGQIQLAVSANDPNG
ncbi:MAG: Ig-like domain-containing protein, partial [Bradymonadaceae bacterium]